MVRWSATAIVGSGYILTVIEDARENTLRLGRKGGRAAVLVAALLLVGAAWAARIDLISEVERNAVPLDWLGTIYRLLAATVLALLGKHLRSRSMWSLASLLALMTAGSLVIGTRWFNAAAEALARPISDVVDRSHVSLKLAVMFIVLALVGGTLVWKAYREAKPFERAAVIRLIVLVAVVGFFVGPVNALSTQGISRWLLFAEDFGQVVSLAVLTGYGSGLLAATAAKTTAATRRS